MVEGFLEEVMPTFTIDCIKPKVKIEEAQKVSGPFYVFLGDLTEFGSSKILQKQIIFTLARACTFRT